MTQGTDAGGARYDVVILGGGLAGLTLALQLKRERPATSVLVVEKREGDAPEAAFKVGESTVEVGGTYFAETLGLRDHIDADQLLKYGLRYFLPAGDNADITKRVEFAPTRKPTVDTFQLDRGRFENEVRARAQALGAEIKSPARVGEVELGDTHRVTYTPRDGDPETVEARWVVDASGRGSVLKRKLGLEKDCPHKINSAWFRLEGGLDLEDWGRDDPEWMGRMPEPGLRMYSTNHLLGEGYWIWLIPLASGPISIGVCADPRLHPFEQISTPDALVGWLREHEPQLAAAVEGRRDQFLDFLKVEHFAFDCERVYSPERWCLTGEAGTFPDALYSPGSDFIAYANNFICDLVTRDLDGEEVKDRAELFNLIYAQVFQFTLALYLDQYKTFASPQAILAKLTFDSYAYFSIVVPMVLNGKMTDFDFMPVVGGVMGRFAPTVGAMAQLFRDWAALDASPHEDHVFRVSEWQPHRERQAEMGQRYDDPTLKALLEGNVERVEALAVVLFHKAAQLLPNPPGEDVQVNPAAISLHPERWEADGLFASGGISVADAKEMFPGIESALWLDRAAAPA